MILDLAYTTRVVLENQYWDMYLCGFADLDNIIDCYYQEMPYKHLPWGAARRELTWLKSNSNYENIYEYIKCSFLILK